jgi:hypothetical protein
VIDVGRRLERQWADIVKWLTENVGVRGVSWESTIINDGRRLVFERDQDKTAFVLRWL